MKALSQPDPEAVASVEATLYNRMVKNAFFGFMKSAAIGAAIGLVLGGIVGAMGIIPPLGFLKEMGNLAGIISGALRGAAGFASVAGGFGAVAGIQSTRDTRRFFLMHEDRNLSPEETREHVLVIAPHVADPKKGKEHFQNLVANKADPLLTR